MIPNTYNTWPQKNSPSPFSWAASTPPRTKLFFLHQASRHSRAGRLPSISHHASTKPCRFNSRPIHVVLTIATQPSQLTWCSQALDLRHPISRPPPSNQKLMYRRSVSTLFMGLRSTKLMTQVSRVVSHVIADY